MKNKNDKNKIRQPMLNPDSIEGQPQQPAAAPAPGTETEAEVSITESGESYISEPAPEAAPDIKGTVSAERGPSGTLDELSQIDPDLLSGKTGPDTEPDANTKLPAKSVHEKTGETNEIAEVALNLGPEEKTPEDGKKRRKTGLRPSRDSARKYSPIRANREDNATANEALLSGRRISNLFTNQKYAFKRARPIPINGDQKRK